jgi:hypothetical protein
MTKIHSTFTENEEIHIPKGFKEAEIDVERALTKSKSGDLVWKDTATFSGTPGPAGPSVPTLTVADILNPIELNTRDNSESDTVRCIEYVTSGENKIGDYEFDASGPTVERSPYVLDGVGGSWGLVGGFAFNWLINTTSSTTFIDYLNGYGCRVNAGDDTKVDIDGCIAVFHDNYSDPNENRVYYKVFPEIIGEDVLNLFTAQVTIFSYDRDGNLIKSNEGLTASQKRNQCKVAGAYHPGQLDSIVEIAKGFPQNAASSYLTTVDMANVLGPQNSKGNIYTAFGVGNQIEKSSGETFFPGINFVTDRQNPNFAIDPIEAPSIIDRVYRSGLGEWTWDRNQTEVDNDNFNNLSTNTLDTVPTGQYTIQYIWWDSLLGQTAVLYGQTTYVDFDSAIANINEPFEKPPELEALGFVYRSALIYQQGLTDLAAAITSDNARFRTIDPKFSGSNQGVSSTATLQSAYDASVNGDITIRETKGAIKLNAETASILNLIELRDELAALQFSVSRDGFITAQNATPSIQGLMSAADKAQSNELKIGWLQYTNSVGLVSTVIGNILNLDTDIDSYSNGLFSKISPTAFRTLFTGYIDISASITALASGLNRNFELDVSKNTVNITRSNRSTSAGSRTLICSCEARFIIDCVPGDDFELIFSPQEGEEFTLDPEGAMMLIKAARVVIPPP